MFKAVKKLFEKKFGHIVGKLDYGVVNIVVMYLTPYQLVRFFRTHGLGFGLVFKYNFGRHLVTWRTFESLIGWFPNIALVGIAIMFGSDEDIGRFEGMLESFHNIERINLSNSDDEIMYSFSVAFWLKFRDVKRMRLNGFMLSNLSALKNSVVRHLDLRGSQCTFDDDIFGSMKKLRSLYISHCRVNMRILEECVKLQELYVSFCDIFSDRPTIVYGKLMRLLLWECDIENIFEMESETLHKILLNACNLSYVPTFGGCRGLKKVIVNECENLRDLSCLNGCVGLEYVAVSGKGMLPDYDNLMNNTKLRFKQRVDSKKYTFVGHI